MADFYATYSAASGSSDTVTALQGTSPWVVAGNGTAGVSATGVLSVQGIAGGTALPISGSITATNPSVGATGAAVPASGTYIAASVAGTLTGLVATANGLKVDVIASALPTGAATEAKQDTQNVNLVSIKDNTSATATTSAEISAKTPALGQALMAASSPVVIASNQSAVPVSGTVAISGTVAATQSGTWTVQPGNTANSTPWLTTVSTALPAGSAIIGNVRVDQTTPGTTNGVVVNTIAPVTTTTAVFAAEGAVAFGSITNAYVTLFTPAATTKMLQMRNNTNAAVSVSMDAGSTTNYTLDAGDALSLDLLANSLKMVATAIQVKYAVGAPTSGSFRINGVS